ncbi:hypothetical protein [Tenacibaculum agarivorans]|uniref:hypothetical protein n=1 Tax=Tenacibaculum agarivorans TaxID=1908389 RepID=UPI00094B7BE5|nr:hypothetical protein [Tenacibaculum agarivorans]
MDNEDKKGLAGLLAGGNNKNTTQKTTKKEPAKTKVAKVESSNVDKKEYKRLYIYGSSQDLLYDIAFTKFSNGEFDYTFGDAIKEGLELLAKSMKVKVKKAPESFKKSKRGK